MTRQVNMSGTMTLTIMAFFFLITCTVQTSVYAQFIGDRNTNTTLSHAINIAEKAIGNSSSAIAAFGQDQGEHAVYTIILRTPGIQFYNVTVDQANGQVLTTEKLSQSELEERHLAHSQKVISEPHLMNNTFVH